MMGRDHALSGALVWLAVGPSMHLTTPEFLLGAAMTTGAAVLPDLDEPGSSVSRSLGMFSQAASVGVRGVSGGHRRATHSLIGIGIAAAAAFADYRLGGRTGVAIMAGLLAVFAVHLLGPRRLHHMIPGAAVGAVVGYWIYAHPGLIGLWMVWTVILGVITHIAGDSLTHGKVPLLWPKLTPRFGLGLFGTGSGVEVVVSILLTIAVFEQGYADILGHGHYLI